MNCCELLLSLYGRIVVYVDFLCLGGPTTECLNVRHDHQWIQGTLGGRQSIYDGTAHPGCLKGLPPLHQQEITRWIKKADVDGWKFLMKFMEKKV